MPSHAENLARFIEEYKPAILSNKPTFTTYGYLGKFFPEEVYTGGSSAASAAASSSGPEPPSNTLTLGIDNCLEKIPHLLSQACDTFLLISEIIVVRGPINDVYLNTKKFYGIIYKIISCLNSIKVPDNNKKI